MGDFKKNHDLAEIAAKRETRETTNSAVVKSMISKQLKSKVVTAKVYPETWSMFTAINKSRGMSNNSVVNMLISDYVKAQKDLLK